MTGRSLIGKRESRRTALLCFHHVLIVKPFFLMRLVLILPLIQKILLVLEVEQTSHLDLFIA